MNGFIRLSLVLCGFITIPASLSFAMGGAAPMHPLETVEKVDVNSYLGKWYEIARLPQYFEKDCVGVTAEYSLMDCGKIKVVNTCRKVTCDGKVTVANGVARVTDAISQAKLKVSFFWPFEGDYWILKLGSNYEYSVVGSPDRKTLWILSRTPQMDETTIAEILAEFSAKGFDTTAMIRTSSCE
jgi:apolipoprotein D and lipocalin family protein